MSENKQFLIFLGGKIRREREKKGLTQEQFGKIIRMHRTYVGMIERGEKNISVVNLHRFAKALNMTIRDLLDF